MGYWVILLFLSMACQSKGDYFESRQHSDDDGDDDDDDDDDDNDDDDDDDDDSDDGVVEDGDEEYEEEMTRCGDKDYYLDERSNLCWTRPVTRTAGVTYQQGDTYCTDLAGSTGEAWHLPSIAELVTLFDGCEIDLDTCDYHQEYQRLDVDLSDPCYCAPDCYSPTDYREMIRLSNDGETRVETCDFAMISTEQMTGENGQIFTCQMYLTGAVACDTEMQSYGCVRPAD